DTARIGAVLGKVSAVQWGLGALFSAMSFWAVGRYDAVVHRLLATGVNQGQAVVSGAAAIAVAQTLGMGALTGALVRWRLVPGLGLWAAMRVSIAVALTFLAGWAVITAVAVLLVPLPLPGARLAALVVLALAAGAALASITQPRALRHLHLPPLRAMSTILGLAALDTLAAGTVLWVFLPNDIAIGATTLIAAYLLALGAGLVLTTPGGVGPFELALLTLLPAVPDETLLAAIIAYRALYYALPAILGGAVLLNGGLPRSLASAAKGPRPVRLTALPTAPHLPFMVEALIEAAPQAEAGWLRHGRLGLLTDPAGRPMANAAQSGHGLIVVGDPLRPGLAPAQVLRRASATAAWALRTPVLYKIGPRMAAKARARGWQVARIAEEAWLDPAQFATTGAQYRQLRRKLRKAEGAGVTITHISPKTEHPLPLGEMDEIANSWRKAHGGERGFSMGQWNRELLTWAHVFLAHDQGGRLLGFITLHANAHEQTLDLMRARPDAPDGTMHALVVAAIEAGAQAGLRRFSLAAAPVASLPTDTALTGWLRAQFANAAGAAGLRQFKSAFAPCWSPLYLAAPSRAGLVFGALDIAREIAQPPRAAAP
ncbi:MAG TPA: DUF2156 domain-containing protein, partial [Rhodobacterales bacterium]|nr:DUF2156 domain-containing protein [Rhodobacterales bacterium]